MSEIVYGKKGWYWVCPNGTYGVVVTDHKLLNKYFSVGEHLYAMGDEDVRYLTHAQFNTMKIFRLLQVDLRQQNPLMLFHNKKYITTSKNALAVT